MLNTMLAPLGGAGLVRWPLPRRNGLAAIDGKPATPPPPTYNLTRALLLAEASYCTATEDQPLLPAELRKTIIVTKVVDNHATRAVVGWDASIDPWVRLLRHGER